MCRYQPPQPVRARTRSHSAPGRRDPGQVWRLAGTGIAIFDGCGRHRPAGTRHRIVDDHMPRRRDRRGGRCPAAFSRAPLGAIK